MPLMRPRPVQPSCYTCDNVVVIGLATRRRVRSDPTHGVGRAGLLTRESHSHGGRAPSGPAGKPPYESGGAAPVRSELLNDLPVTRTQPGRRPGPGPGRAP
eukprot:752476-Hanusia_phi.AAC.1